MLIYIINIILVVGLAVILKKIPLNEKNKKIRFCIKFTIVLLPSLLAGFRYGIGTDYFSVYKQIFDGVYKEGSRSIEYGYLLLNYIGRLLNNNFSIVMFLSSFITNAFFIFGIYQYDEEINVPMAILIYLLMYYQITYNAVRQFIGMSITFWALKFLNYDEKKISKKDIIIKNAKFFISTIIAFSFHKSAIIMLIIPLIKYIFSIQKHKKIKLIFYSLVFLFIISSDYIGKLMSYIPFLKYYANYLYAPENIKVSIWYFVKTIPIIIPAFFFKREIHDNKHINLLFDLMLMGVLLLLLSYFSKSFGERIALYFIIMQIIIVPYYIEKSKKLVIDFKKIKMLDKFKKLKHFTINEKKCFIIFISIYVVFFTSYWYHDFIYKNMNETMPYTSIFSKNK